MQQNRIKRYIAALLCSALIIGYAPAVINAGAVEDADWIAAADAYMTERSTDDWSRYLSARFYNAVGFDESGTLSWAAGGVTPWDGTTSNGVNGAPDVEAEKTAAAADASLLPAYDEASLTYYVYYPQQFLAAVNELNTTPPSGTATEANPYTIKLMEDLDLGGEQGRLWPQDLALPAYTVIDGSLGTDANGEILRANIYNLKILTTGNAANGRPGPSATGFIAGASAVRMSNICFMNAHVLGGFLAAVAIGFTEPADSAQGDWFELSNITVKDSIVISRNWGGASETEGGSAALCGRLQFPSSVGGTISNCNATGCVIAGYNHQGGLTASMINLQTAERCFSADGVVISFGNHSGGLFSCASRVETFRECFVDAEVYGSSETGVFLGTISGQPCNFVSCYSSGFIEGQEQLGGFVGHINSASTVAQFYDCYSTALVGMRSNGNMLGGFVGYCDNVSSGAMMRAYNCYAAGEVGSADTDSSPDAQDTAITTSVSRASTDLLGGFIGAMRILNITPQTTYESCYYDKQTTAMREWGVGNANTSFPGITGVLSSDTDKSGNGLMCESPDSANGGFIGFNSDTSAQYGGDASLKWNYSSEDHYPELKAFKNADNAGWLYTDTAELVKAYSLSSTSGVLLNVWDYGLNTSTGEYYTEATGSTLPETTYCTVRDLTSGFELTSTYNAAEDSGVLTTDGWVRTKTSDGDGSSVATTTIEGVTYDVLSLKHQNGQYLCDDLVPGVAWLMVNCKYAGQNATRRVRVIPTASIEAGSSVVITDKYDHADDVELFYSTATRMIAAEAAGTTDVTTGIFPDSPISSYTARQARLAGSVDMTGGDNSFRDIPVGYMSDGSDNAENGKIFTYVYEITGFTSSNEITRGPLLEFGAPTDPSSADTLAEQLNGVKTFTNTDKRYLVSYMWVLKDGRILQDAKIIRRARIPFSVGLNLYKNAVSNPYPAGGYLYTGIENEPLSVLTDFSGFTGVASENTASASGWADYKEHAQTAWQLRNSADTLESVTITIKIGSETYHRTETGLVSGSTIKVPVTEYRIVYRNGQYFTIPETIEREYMLLKDAATDTWYLNFEKEDERGQTYVLNDVETDIIVDVVVNSIVSATGDLVVSKTVTGIGAPSGDSFTFTVTFSDGGIYGGVASGGTFNIKGGESKTFSGIPVGVMWSVTESAKTNYTANNAVQSGTISVSGANVSFVNRYSAAGSAPSDIPDTGDAGGLQYFLPLTLFGIIGLAALLFIRRKYSDG